MGNESFEIRNIPASPAEVLLATATASSSVLNLTSNSSKRTI